ncbi:hypothetical protein CNYM01_12179 [Colletotrichum nymphaeae SA-01]|uniref:Uncharacterized protein n=1 Tax=Colletotrichum nymphaeae SA-01 TaxID=1460502 RepID=A0A135UKC4_9PEZI|nr:hypothetical protein CNYM01_12179 [Colletotrichum nymphaeae SA-01]
MQSDTIPGDPPPGLTISHFTHPRPIAEYVFDASKLTQATDSSISYQFTLVKVPTIADYVDPKYYSDIGVAMVQEVASEGRSVREHSWVSGNKAHVLTSEADVVVAMEETKAASDAILRAKEFHEGHHTIFTSEFQSSAEGIRRVAEPKKTTGTAGPGPSEGSPSKAPKARAKGSKRRRGNDGSAVEDDDDSAGSEGAPEDVKEEDTKKKKEKKTSIWVAGRPDQLYFVLADGVLLPYLKGAAPNEDCRVFAGVEAKDVGKIWRWIPWIKKWQQRNSNRVSVDDFESEDEPGDENEGQEGDQSALPAPVKKLLQQAAAYAMIFRMTSVTMTDYVTWLLLDFYSMEITPKVTPEELWRAGVGDRVRISVVDAREDERVEAAILGFLVEARKKTPLDT